MSEGQRIGIFGGTFDPIHRAHLDVARAAIAHAGLDEVRFVVAATPPHKQKGVYASAQDRLDMVAEALGGESTMVPSRIEIDRDGPSYTVDTLRELQQQHPRAVFHLIVGYDALVDLPNWHEAEEILHRARVLAVSRPDAPFPVPDALDGRYEWLPFKEKNISSTEIRRRLAAGEPVDHLLPEGVERLIRERNLYDVRRPHPAT